MPEMHMWWKQIAYTKKPPCLHLHIYLLLCFFYFSILFEIDCLFLFVISNKVHTARVIYLVIIIIIMLLLPLIFAYIWMMKYFCNQFRIACLLWNDEKSCFRNRRSRDNIMPSFNENTLRIKSCSKYKITISLPTHGLIMQV